MGSRIAKGGFLGEKIHNPPDDDAFSICFRWTLFTMLKILLSKNQNKRGLMMSIINHRLADPVPLLDLLSYPRYSVVA